MDHTTATEVPASTTQQFKKPVIVLIPGAWHSITAYESLVERLQNEGYRVDPVELPSTGGDPAAIKNSGPDVETVAFTISRYARDGDEVVLLAHSAGGWIACEAAKDLTARDRNKNQEAGGVIRIAFMAGVVPDAGESVLGPAGGHEGLPFIRVIGDVDVPHRDQAKDIFYNDIPDDVAERYIAELKPSPWVPRFDELTYAAWKKIPCSYLICENDNAVPHSAQEDMVGHPQGNFDHVERIPSGHSPWLSMPEETSAFVVRAAERQGNWREEMKTPAY